MALIKTETGGMWNTEKPAFSHLITHLNESGKCVTSTLRIVKITGTHMEFGELKTDLEVKDQFGEQYEICEDFLYHR